jgi:hypothetical protein
VCIGNVTFYSYAGCVVSLQLFLLNLKEVWINRSKGSRTNVGKTLPKIRTNYDGLMSSLRSKCTNASCPVSFFLIYPG